MTTPKKHLRKMNVGILQSYYIKWPLSNQPIYLFIYFLVNKNCLVPSTYQILPKCGSTEPIVLGISVETFNIASNAFLKVMS